MTDDLIVAAGAVLYKIVPADRHLIFATVHKAKYDEWSLPKGKVKESEDWKECALREVREETGTSGLLLNGPAATSSCLVDGIPKIVVWFVMEGADGQDFGAGSEIYRCAWLSADEVGGRLAHASELAVFESIVLLIEKLQ